MKLPTVPKRLLKSIPKEQLRNPTIKEITDVLHNAGIRDVASEKRIDFYLCMRGKPIVSVSTLDSVTALYDKGFIFVGMRYRTGKDMRSRG